MYAAGSGFVSVQFEMTVLVMCGQVLSTSVINNITLLKGYMFIAIVSQ